ncbi:VWA domain-containing protein [Pseudotenacibaculum haliotis]|uniref:VWA domain-containing protein n=1 Tax=Pseudotenacibaculum haliotis TaxID=1862138 RepID=A0ABW5LSE5_9FLAO
METSTIIFIVLAFVISIAIAYFQYYFKAKRVGNITLLLFALRSMVIFLLLLLLINPSIDKKSFINQKPALSVLVDNSRSTQFFKQDSLVNQLINSIKNNDRLQKKFDVSFYSFGEQFAFNDSLSFDEDQTNISEALVNIEDLNKGKNDAVILMSDGNQTLGNDYEYVNTKKTVFPVAIGDTLKYDDIRISQLNVNRYSFINNQFPVEAIVLYEGNQSVRANFTIEHRGKVIYRKQVRLTADKNTETIRTNIKSEREGVNFYKARVSFIEGEKNRNNNSKSFSVEVIDKQSQILILSSMYHPDLGTLKKSIERDQQRKATIELIDSKDFKIDDFQLVILYQPNFQFKDAFKQIKDKKINFFLISGSKTDWQLINSEAIGIRKNSIDQSEDYGANFNAGYLIFSQKDIDFNNFPPLKDKFGETLINIPHQTLLYQSINGFSSKEPMLATADENNHKKVFLLGEGIWRWRSSSFLNTNSFESFDEFIGNIIQYASSKKVRDRLAVDIESIYNANSLIKVGAFYVNNNFEFDDRATLIFTAVNKETNESKSYPFSLANNSYQLEIEGLESGEYDYTVRVEGQNINRKGTFRVSEYSVEEQFTNADHQKLARLADKTNGKMYYGDQGQTLINDLIENNQYVTVQRSIQRKESIIDWKWIMFLIVGLLAVEWFTRKYHGKI